MRQMCVTHQYTTTQSDKVNRYQSMKNTEHAFRKYADLWQKLWSYCIFYFGICIFILGWFCRKNIYLFCILFYHNMWIQLTCSIFFSKICIISLVVFYMFYFGSQFLETSYLVYACYLFEAMMLVDTLILSYYFRSPSTRRVWGMDPKLWSLCRWLFVAGTLKAMFANTSF